MKTPHLRACDIADRLDELVRAPSYRWRGDGWRASVRKLLAQLHDELVAADREVADAFDAKRTRWGVERRPCAWCGGPMPEDARCDASTCSKRCRQAKSRGGTGRKVRVWPRGVRTRAPAGDATHATEVSADESVAAVAGDRELGKRRMRRGASIPPDDWRSAERRAQREQLSMMVAPPVGASSNTESEG
jgi:hypothetical protein